MLCLELDKIAINLYRDNFSSKSCQYVHHKYCQVYFDVSSTKSTQVSKTFTSIKEI